MTDRQHRLMKLRPPTLGQYHPRCRACAYFADYEVIFSAGQTRTTSSTYCAEHLPEKYRPLQEEADRKYAERLARR